MNMQFKKCKLIEFHWRALILVIFVIYISLFYGDILATHYHAINFLDCLFDGKLLEFYDYSIQNSWGGFPAVYSLPMYIIFAVWDFPVWILIKIGFGEVQSPVYLLWIKLFLVMALIGATFFLYHLLKKAGNVNPWEGIFLFLSSLIVVVPVIAIAQYDILSIFFTLWGINNYLDEEKTSWKTYIIFSIAISLKMFAIFPFLFLTLLKEKKVSKILFNVVCSLSMTVLFMLPYVSDDGYKIAVSEFNGGMADKLIMVTLNGGTSGISIFFLCFFALCVMSYMFTPQDKQDTVYILSWINSAFFLAFFLFVQFAHPYWIVLLAPYLYLLISRNYANFKINMILEIALEISIILVQGYVFNWVYFSDTSFSCLLLKKFPVFTDLFGISNLGDLLNLVNLGRFIPAVYALFAVSGVALLIINFPKTQFIERTDKNAENKLIMSWIFGIRLFLLVLYFALTFAITYFI